MLLVITLLAASALLALLFTGPRPVPDSEARLYSGQEGTPAPPPLEPRREILKWTVQPGETISSLLGTFLTTQELHQLTEKSRSVYPFSRICAGQPYQLCTEEGNLASFAYDIDREERLLIRQGEEGFEILREPIPYTRQVAVVQGTITSSLFESVAETGEGPELAIALADIFAWDIDFLRDIRSGDSFRALVEKRFREGAAAGYGQVLAAEFTNQGETYRAIRFQDGDQPPSYYDRDGNNLRKAFLKAPLSYSRISSGFSMKRFHPVTKTWKAHPAIDYAAPTGTPIKAVGDGTIVTSGYNGNNGNHIKIRHNSSYETLYLHMSRFAKGMKKGQKVVQGQVIGYVGSTGLATGPHLCFRMYRNGQPVNPYRLKVPSAAAIGAESQEAFRARATELLARLDAGEEEAGSALAAAPREGGVN